MTKKIDLHMYSDYCAGKLGTIDNPKLQGTEDNPVVTIIPVIKKKRIVKIHISKKSSDRGQ